MVPARLLSALAAFVVVSTGIAHAAPITLDISFTATGTGAASGSYVLTFDPTLQYIDATTGLTVVSFNDTLAPPAQTGFDYVLSTGRLLIGGLVGSVGGASGGTDDYVIDIEDLTTSPSFSLGSFYTASNANTGFTDLTGTVTVTTPSVQAVTPEPSSLILFGSGILGIAGTVRRRCLRG